MTIDELCKIRSTEELYSINTKREFYGTGEPPNGKKTAFILTTGALAIYDIVSGAKGLGLLAGGFLTGLDAYVIDLDLEKEYASKKELQKLISTENDPDLQSDYLVLEQKINDHIASLKQDSVKMVTSTEYKIADANLDKGRDMFTDAIGLAIVLGVMYAKFEHKLFKPKQDLSHLYMNRGTEVMIR